MRFDSHTHHTKVGSQLPSANTDLTLQLPPAGSNRVLSSDGRHTPDMWHERAASAIPRRRSKVYHFSCVWTLKWILPTRIFSFSEFVPGFYQAKPMLLPRYTIAARQRIKEMCTRIQSFQERQSKTLHRWIQKRVSLYFLCRYGEIGKHKGFKIPRRLCLVGSSPTIDTSPQLCHCGAESRIARELEIK